MNDTLNFFGTEISCYDILEIGAFAEEKKLLFLIPVARMVPFVIIQDGQRERIITKPKASSPDSVELMALMKLEIDIATDKEGVMFNHIHNSFGSEAIGFSYRD